VLPWDRVVEEQSQIPWVSPSLPRKIRPGFATASSMPNAARQARLEAEAERKL
jgi:hypothetical protein